MSDELNLQAIEAFVEKLGADETVMPFASQAQQFKSLACELARRLDALDAAQSRARAATTPCKHESPQTYHYRDPQWEAGRLAAVVNWCKDCGAIFFMAHWELPRNSVR